MALNIQRDTANEEVQKQKSDFVSFMQESPLVGEDMDVQHLERAFTKMRETRPDPDGLKNLVYFDDGLSFC